MWSPRQQGCLAIVRTRLPSEERKFSLSLPSLFILCAGFAWILFIPLPLGQEVPVYGLVSLKLIILGADCEHWVGGRDKGFVINFMSRGWEVWSCEHPARFGLLSGGAVHHIVFLVWLRSITLIFHLLLKKTWCLTYSKEMLKVILPCLFLFCFLPLCMLPMRRPPIWCLSHAWHHPQIWNRTFESWNWTFNVGSEVGCQI